LKTLTPGERITNDVYFLLRSRWTSESRHQSRCAAAEKCTNWGCPSARGNQSWE
jgi:SET domain-containing protein